jgi:hypothetical protein
VLGSLEGLSSNLGHCYIIIQLPVCPSVSGNKLELVCGSFESGGAVLRVNMWRTHIQTSCSAQSRYIVMLAGGLLTLACVGQGRPLPRLTYRPFLSNSFGNVTNFTVIRMKALCSPQRQREACLKIWFKSSSQPLLILSACRAKLHYNLIAFIAFALNICTVVSVACILQQTLLSYDPASAYTQAYIFHASVNHCFSVTSYTILLLPTLNPRPCARIPLSEVSVCSESGNWNVLILSGTSPLVHI